MFREMRRIKQQMPIDKAIDVLKRNTSGVLGLLGDDDYPYTVPLSYVYHEHKIYFHGATSGHKIDAVKKHSKASFCVIDQDQVVPEKLTTYFRSVIVFGKVSLLEGEAKLKAIELLGLNYFDNIEAVHKEIEKEKDRFTMIELDIEHITGKEAIELL